MEQVLSLTVKVPFSGDHAVRSAPSTTVERLCETVMQTCPPRFFNGVAQCIVHRGRILPGHLTLADARIPNNAVLHLMRKPRAPPPAAARPNSHAPADEHHAHANVVFGHIAVEGRVQQNDVRHVLTSVLEALGFSRTATDAAAAAAAAVAVTHQAPDEPSTAPLPALQTAWQDGRAAQTHLRPLRDPLLSPRAPLPEQPPGPGPRDPDGRSGAAAALLPSLGNTLRDLADRLDREASLPALVTRTPQQAATFVSAMGAVATALSSAAVLFATLRPPDPGPPPPLPNFQAMLRPRAADAPAPADDPAPAEASARDPPAPPDGARESPSPPPADEAREHPPPPPATDAREYPSPPPADEVRAHPSPSPVDGAREHSSPPPATGLREYPSPPLADGAREHPSPPLVDDGSTVDRASEDERRGPADTAELEPPGGVVASEPVCTSAPPTVEELALPRELPQPGASDAAPAGAPPTDQQMTDGLAGVDDDREEGDARDDTNQTRTNSTTHPHTTSHIARQSRSSPPAPPTEQQVANADFLIRLLCYYFVSLAESDIPLDIVPTDAAGETAASVLETVYGERRPLQPDNLCLLALQEMMHGLTPEDFHCLCRGYFHPLAEIRQEFWGYIRHQVMHVLHRGHGHGDSDEAFHNTFVETVCEALHEFVHVVEALDGEMAREQMGYEVERNFEFCSFIMHAIEHKASDLVRIFEADDSQEFSIVINNWLVEAFGDVATLMMSCLELRWEEFLHVLRLAIHEVSVNLVGSQFSVILPFIANLFTARATECHRITIANVADHVASDSDQDQPPDQPPDPPEEPNSGTAGGTGRYSEDHGRSRSGQGRTTSSSGAAGGETSGGSRHNQPTTGGSTGGRDTSMHRPANAGDDHSGDEDDDRRRLPRTGIDDEMADDLDYDDVDLDDDDMDSLVAELDDEYEYEARTGDNVDGAIEKEDDDFSDMARELQSEVPPAQAAGPSSNAPYSTMQSGNAGRVAGLSSAFAPSMNGLGIAAGMGTSAAAQMATRNRTAFSSRVSPSPGFGVAQSSTRVKDEFDAVLGMRQGAKWRHVAQEDERKMQTSRPSPLSRGYRGERGHVPPLDVESSTRHAVDAARAVGREAQLSTPQLQALESTARQNAPLYLREFENALQGRLATDPDFDRERFPAAAARFSR